MTGDAGLRIGVLGPLLVTRGGMPVKLPRSKARVLLAVLAMSAGQPVGAARLADLIWADDQPEHWRASLQTVVARLRGTVPGAIVTVSDGYLLDADPDHVDALRFRHLVREAGRADTPALAISLLDDAVGLWRGDPLADLRSATLQRSIAPGLTDEYLSAVQQRAALELAAGSGDRFLAERVITELRELTGRYPLREPLWDQLLRALADAGRSAEAIIEYHRAREILAAELGVDPSSELQELYIRLLQADRDDVPAAPSPAAPSPGTQSSAAPSPAAPSREPPGIGSAGGAPRRLPADTGVFTGRHAELARLLELGEAVGSAGGSGAVVISAIDGMAGIGKTALALRAAHRLAGRFGDGQLFIDLHGYTQGYPPRTASQALETFLGAMGVPPQQIPEDTEERAALYRQRLAGTRTLIVLDNAVDEAQVRPLIPGDAGCLVLITSRRKLKSLDDAHVVALDVLPDPDAVALLRTVAGAGRVTADDPAAAEVAGLCGRLPLALRIAGALLRNRPAWTVAHLAGKLRTARTRLDAFADGDRDLAALFALSAQDLSDDQRRLYGYLGLIPGPDVDTYAVAALAATDPGTAERVLQQLVDHNLLREATAGRYGMHDLIRAHARALAADDPAAEREAALDRLLDYYQHTALRADARIARYAQPAPASPAPGHAPALTDADAARAWLRAERGNLAACLEHAISNEIDERTVALSAGLANLLRIDGPWPRAIDAQTAGADAAARLGDRAGQARALANRGSVQGLTVDYPGAKASSQAALELYRETGDKAGQAHALTDLGTALRVSGDGRGAGRSLQAALELYRETGDKAGQAYALTALGITWCVSGDYPGSKASLREGLRLYRETGDMANQAEALTQLTVVQSMTGEYEEAIRSGESALAIAREAGDRLYQARALVELGAMQRLTGDYASAAGNERAAHDIYRELDDRHGQANALTELGEIRRLTGDYESAARDLEEAVRILRNLGSRTGQAWALNYYAAAIADTGDLAQAIAIYQDALRLAREVRQPDDEAIALHGLGEVHLREGELRAGTAYLREALEIYRQLGMPAARQIAARLTEIGDPVTYEEHLQVP